MRVLLVPNIHNPAAVSAATDIATWLKDDHEVVMAKDDARACDMDGCAVPLSEVGQPGLVVAFGGDGTILKAFHELGDVDSPILGVKFGRLGFLAGATADEMRSSIESAIAGEAPSERRATLKVEVVMDGRVTGSYRAMNEVAVTRESSGRLVSLDVVVSGTRIASHRADGFVVATATGSTAYALSAGGPIVSPVNGGMVLVPVASHTLQARAVITAPDDVVEIVLPDTQRSAACLIVDGDAAPCRQPIQRVVIRRGDRDVTLLKCHGRDFYDTVAEEFFGG